MDKHIKILTILLEHHWDKDFGDSFGWGRWDKLTEYQYKRIMNNFIYSHLNNENNIALHS